MKNQQTKRLGRVIAAGLLLLSSFTLAAWWLPKLELRPGGYPGKFLITERVKPEPGAFFVSRGEHELSHLALYHDIGSSIDSARQADILIIGNSRGQLGFDEQYLVAQARALGLRIFNLSVGHADSAQFARVVMQRHQLKPKLLIVNGGDFFYNRSYSDWGQEVVAMSRWQAYKTFFEYSLGWWLEKRLHRYLPYLDYFQRGRYPWIHYRSPETGWWQNTQWPDARYPIKPGEEKKRYDRALPVARALKEQVGAWNGQLVLTIVPYRMVRTGHLPFLAEQLDVPYILPGFDDLATADGSHLTADSARLASENLWRELMSEPKLRQRLGVLAEQTPGPGN